MPRDLIIAWAGRRQADDWERLCARYRGRIGGAWRVRDLPIRARGSIRGTTRRRAEGRALLAALPSPCWLVTLEEGGRGLSSAELAEWLESLVERWPHPIAFLVGSDLGLSREVRSAANERLSLGPLTLPHRLARLVLYEQLFRAAARRAGINYDR